MNNQEAKSILQAYRPGGVDASDPVFAEALEQVHRDPALRKWLAEQDAFDTHLQARLRDALPVPRGLKSDLLARGKISRPAPWWSRPVAWAAVAAMILVLGIGTFLLLPEKPVPLASFRQAMAGYSTDWKGHVAFESHDMAKVQQWLQGQGAPAGFEVPTAFPAGTTHGCRVVDWNGQKATMVCFVQQDGQHLDLFVMDRVGLPELSEQGTPLFAAAGGRMTAAWVKGGKVYLLIGDDRKSLDRVFQPT